MHIVFTNKFTGIMYDVPTVAIRICYVSWCTCSYICFIYLLRVSCNFDTCFDCKSIYIFCISEWPRDCNFITSFLSCFIWGSKRNCNTEVVQSSAAINTMLVKKIMWYLSFSFPSMNHPHFCHLYFEVLYFRFPQWWRNIILSMLK